MEATTPDGSNSFQQALDAYKSGLQQAAADMQREFDKNLLLVAGGAFAVSMAFVKDIVASKAGGIIKPDLTLFVWAWALWAISILATLYSFMTSSAAMRKAIDQTDERYIYIQHAGGRWDVATRVLNWIAPGAFIGGMIFMLLFIYNSILN